MQYRVKRTDLRLLGREIGLTANIDSVCIDATTATAAVAQFIAARRLHLIGTVDPATGGTANAMCKDGDGQIIVIRAFPDPDALAAQAR